MNKAEIKAILMKYLDFNIDDWFDNWGDEITKDIMKLVSQETEAVGMKTETNKYIHCNHYHELNENQEIIDLGTGKFVVDKQRIQLLKALNECGLETRSHCYGHETGISFVAIKTTNITNIQVRMNELQEILIQWKRTD